jgi:hypothetical protein
MGTLTTACGARIPRSKDMAHSPQNPSRVHSPLAHSALLLQASPGCRLPTHVPLAALHTSWLAGVCVPLGSAPEVCWQSASLLQSEQVPTAIGG